MAGSSSEDEDQQQALIQQVISKALTPVHIATSKPALKAYLGTILFLGASLILLACSTTAYFLFYYYFIPRVGLSKVIHLQYADGPFPHATTYLTSPSSTIPSLVALQPYDISIHLHLPRTPTNLAAGNFMLDLSLNAPPATRDEPVSISQVLSPKNTTIILARSRRPAMLPYQSPITSLTRTFLSLPFHTLALRDIDATTLSVPMFEQVVFSRGSRNLPASASLEIQTQAHTQIALLGKSAGVEEHIPLQVYSATIEIHARFRGLRWLMYNWRITSFLVFTSGFYCVALISTGVTLGGITFLSSSSSSGQDKIKKEANVSLDSKITTNGHATQPTIKSEEEIESGEESALSLSNLSDTAATFPTLARQMPIRYPVQSLFQQGAASASSSRLSRIKIEDQDDDEVAGIEASTALEPLAATTAGEFAEDEDEEEEEEREGDGGRDRDKDRDSGIGTSVEESAKEAGRGLQRRRGGGRGQSSSSRSGAGVRP